MEPAPPGVLDNSAGKAGLSPANLKLVIIVAVVAPTLLAVCAACCVAVWLRKRRWQQQEQQEKEVSSKGQPQGVLAEEELQGHLSEGQLQGVLPEVQQKGLAQGLGKQQQQGIMLEVQQMEASPGPEQQGVLPKGKQKRVGPVGKKPAQPAVITPGRRQGPNKPQLTKQEQLTRRQQQQPQQQQPFKVSKLWGGGGRAGGSGGAGGGGAPRGVFQKRGTTTKPKQAAADTAAARVAAAAALELTDSSSVELGSVEALAPGETGFGSVAGNRTGGQAGQPSSHAHARDSWSGAALFGVLVHAHSLTWQDVRHSVAGAASDFASALRNIRNSVTGGHPEARYRMGNGVQMTSNAAFVTGRYDDEAFIM